ncbi:MAG: hypothetical protein R6V85_08635 [Polyangia bacterium]
MKALSARAVPVLCVLALGCGSTAGAGRAVRAAPEEEAARLSSASPVESSRDVWIARRRAAQSDGRVRFGEVRQPGTGLWWLRCPVGQRWDGERCAGEPRVVPWERTDGACPPGYRIPRVEEYLLLLGDCDHQAGRTKRGMCRACGRSAICLAMFGRDEGWYWSTDGVMMSGQRSGTWSVAFAHGLVYLVENHETRSALVRCLREQGEAE